MRRNWILLAIGLLTAVLAIGAVACSDNGNDDGNGGPTATAAAMDEPTATTEAGDGAGSTVEVNLLEWQVVADVESAAAGPVSFNASDIGGANHQLAVLRTDLAADALPTNDDGSVDESGEGVELIGKISELTPGLNETLDLDLEAGSYVLICNLVDTNGSHYDLGMTLAFEVTE